MNNKFMRFSVILFGVFSLVAGIGVWVTDEPLREMCRRSCWLNELLYSIFGDYYGKAIYGGLGVSVGSFLLVASSLGKRKERTKSHKKKDRSKI